MFGILSYNIIIYLFKRVNFDVEKKNEIVVLREFIIFMIFILVRFRLRINILIIVMCVRIMFFFSII